MVKNKSTVPQILEAYQQAEKFETDTAFAAALGWKKQSLSQYKAGIYKPQVSTLRVLAFLESDNWKGRMAVELLEAMGRGDQVPTMMAAHWVRPTSPITDVKDLAAEDGKKLLEVVKVK